MNSGNDAKYYLLKNAPESRGSASSGHSCFFGVSERKLGRAAKKDYLVGMVALCFDQLAW